MQNIMIAHANAVDAATLSGGSWSSALPRANMQDRRLRKVARTADDAASSTKWDVDFGAQAVVQIIALAGHNCSTDATIRIRGSSDPAFATSEYDSGSLFVWPAIYDSAVLEWEDDNFWSGTANESDRTNYTTLFLHVPAEQQYLRYWRIEIVDTGNPDGYVQIGRFWMSRYWRSDVNADWGLSLAWEDKSTSDEAIGGAEYFSRKAQYRVCKFQLSWLTEAEAYQRAFELQRACGQTGEVLFVTDTDDEMNLLRRSMLGRMRQLSPLTLANYAQRTMAFEIKETV